MSFNRGVIYPVNFTRSVGTGYRISRTREDGTAAFGYIEQCPYCEATHIMRMNPLQKTCGRIPCMETHNRESRRRAVAAKKAAKRATK